MILWSTVAIALAAATQAAVAQVAPPVDGTGPIASEELSIIDEFAEQMRLTIRAQQCGANVFYTGQVNRRFLAGKMSYLSPGAQKVLQQRVMELGVALGRESLNRSSPPCDQTLAAFDARAVAAGLTPEEIQTAKERRP